MERSLIDAAAQTISDAIDEIQPVKVYALISGGNDSTCVSHLAAIYGPRLDALVHINTGIGIEASRDFVRSYAQFLELPLIEKHPPKTYEELILEHGFPGPAAHRYMYSWLKERPLREVRREAQTRRGEPVMFITGVRTQESDRRMGHVASVQKDGAVHWVAPILEFTGLDVREYISEHDLPKNEVVDFLHMSGECLCGAFSKPGELDEISVWYPEVAEHIRDLERKVHEIGKNSCHWGPQSSKKIREAAGMLCSGCAFTTVPALVTN